MTYQVNINGLDVCAEYSEESIQNVFLPLLRTLVAMQKEKGRRILVYLAAPPAAGKSTLVSFLEQLARTTFPDCRLMSIGMDGFHRYQDDLLSHTTIRNGKEIPLVNIKGAPETFNLSALHARIRKLKQEDVCPWPVYNRLLHNPVEHALTVSGDIILLEGNYLLLDLPGWCALAPEADYTISITADPAQLRERLIARKCASGTAYAQAVEFVEQSDLANARLILAHSLPPDLQLVLQKDGSYTRS